MEKNVDVERLNRHLSELAWAPTVEISRAELVAVLSRLEEAEQATSNLEQDRDYWKASALDSEQAVDRVREVAAGWATNDRPFRAALLRALDGDGRG